MTSGAQAKRFRLVVEYDGTAYGGWQVQPNAPSIQQSLIDAARPLSSSDVDVQGSGRTDAGVHACGQVAHLALVTRLEAGDVERALNARLPRDIRVLEVARASDSFHARFSARGKRYLYALETARRLSVFDRGRVWHVPGALSIEAMRAGAKELVGRHDFSAFSSKAGERPDNVRRVTAIRIRPARRTKLLVFVAGEGFLYNMVRTMVAALVAVGRSELDPADLKAALTHRDRARLPATAPPQGLYLWRVRYGPKADRGDGR
ncbi:MAG: tRNA pseudouridine(38-40) synthase TruA [Planctomycetota bacterium]